ncbi:MAG: hypothetical protein KatS3mg076_2314 [Candidatus Binatia bacterium]|nr:MAG: hypothetical protein KatS3mg076_2314 [Candidatus Binatia bacterium]
MLTGAGAEKKASCRWLAAALWVVVLAPFATGCRQKPAPLPPLGDVSAPSAAGGLWVRLAWQGPADLDLYVTDPSFETVYFAYTPVRSGGRLVEDARCPGREGKPSVELVTWKSPPEGTYRVGVDYIARCERGAPDRIPFRLVVEADGQRLERRGEAEFERFEPVVLEFRLESDSGVTRLEVEG